MIAQMSLQTWQGDYCKTRDLSKRTTLFYVSVVRRYEKWHGGIVSLVTACESVNDFLAHLADGKNRYTAHSYRCGLLTLLRAYEAACRELGI